MSFFRKIKRRLLFSILIVVVTICFGCFFVFAKKVNHSSKKKYQTNAVLSITTPYDLFMQMWEGSDWKTLSLPIISPWDDAKLARNQVLWQFVDFNGSNRVGCIEERDGQFYLDYALGKMGVGAGLSGTFLVQYLYNSGKAIMLGSVVDGKRDGFLCHFIKYLDHEDLRVMWYCQCSKSKDAELPAKTGKPILCSFQPGEHLFESNDSIVSMYLKEGQVKRIQIWCENPNCDGICVEWGKKRETDLIEIGGKKIYENKNSESFESRSCERDEQAWLHKFKNAIKERQYDVAKQLYYSMPKSYNIFATNILNEIEAIK